VVLWSPLSSARDDMLVRNAGVAASLERVDTLVSQIMAQRHDGGGKPSARNLTALINRSTSAMNLQVSRLQPNSRGELQVRLEQASFDDIVAWLYDMEYSQGLLVREVSITRAGGVGRVNASIRLAQGT